jgi:ABC-type molybdenum transport system ATPase subunit/photorepair protein PhrA
MPADNLKIFSKPRREIATPYLRQWIGHTSPEIFSAFPRNMRLTAGDAIGSGYEGVFSKREFKPDQIDRIKSLLEPFKEQLISSPRAGRQASHNRTSIDSIYDAEFSHFPASQQAILLFLRSIVSRPRLLVLDEFSQTIDEQAWEICKTLLENEWREMKVDGVDQAVVVVSHYESEVPWKGGKVFRLKDGRVDHSE